MITKTITLASTDRLFVGTSETQDDNGFIFWANADIEFSSIKTPGATDIIPLGADKMFGFKNQQTFYIRGAIGTEVYLAPFDGVLGGNGGSLDYVNIGINNIAVGGLGANQGPFDTTFQNMFDMILYPFTQQTSVLTISPNTIFEKGVEQAPLLMTATTIKSTNPTYAITSTVFKRAGVTIDTQAGDTTPQIFSVVPSIIDTTVFSIEVTNSNAYISTNSKTITAVYPMYGGNSVADDYLTRTDLASIEAVLLNKNVVAKSNQTITDTFTNARNVFIYPASYGVLTSILDDNGFETISNYDMFTKSYTTRDGLSTSYNIYQLKANTSQTAFANTYKF